MNLTGKPKGPKHNEHTILRDDHRLSQRGSDRITFESIKVVGYSGQGDPRIALFARGPERTIGLPDSSREPFSFAARLISGYF